MSFLMEHSSNNISKNLLLVEAYLTGEIYQMCKEFSFARYIPLSFKVSHLLRYPWNIKHLGEKMGSKN